MGGTSLLTFSTQNQGCGSGWRKCSFRCFRFRFQNVARILVAIPPTKWERLCSFHIPARNGNFFFSHHEFKFSFLACPVSYPIFDYFFSSSRLKQGRITRRSTVVSLRRKKNISLRESVTVVCPFLSQSVFEAGM